MNLSKFSRLSRSTKGQFIHTIRISNSLVEYSARNSLDLNDRKEITWYACGPTVYDSAHLGHARTYVATDILRRIICDYFKVPLKFAMGITDIDDKIIKKGKEKNFVNNEDFRKLAADLEIEFLQDMDALNVRRPDAILRVTEHIPDIITFVNNLIEKKHAYVAGDGVYFDLSSMPSIQKYDKFGCANVAEAEEEDNITAEASDRVTKRNPRDFALWKITNPSDPGWSSPWGYGRPGWHIECSAVTHSYFGEELDIHSGGVDLKFPHHTNEIAQSECHHGKEWVKYWLHTGHLHIKGRKMSKSLKNFISIQDYFTTQLTSSPSDDFRIFCLQHKYSATLTYAPERILEAASFRNKCLAFYQQIDFLAQRLETTYPTQLTRRPTMQSIALQERLNEAKQQIPGYLANDFDTPAVLNCLGNLIGESIQYFTLVSTVPAVADTPQASVVIINFHPIEPLLNVMEYSKGILSMLGLQFPHTQSINTVDNASNQHQSQHQLENAIDSAVLLRSNVRNIAIQGMKLLKQYKKSDPSLVDWKVLESQYQALLHHTDEMRDQFNEKVGIQIDDYKDTGSTWRKKA